MTRFQNDTWRRLAGKNRSPERRASRTAKASASSHSARRGRVPAGPSALRQTAGMKCRGASSSSFSDPPASSLRATSTAASRLSPPAAASNSSQERGPVLAQVAVTRGQFIHEPALFQTGKGAAVRRCLAQAVLAHSFVEGADRCLAVSIEQGVYSGQQRVDAGSRATAQATALVLERQARPPFQPDHILVVHGHGLVEQSL